MGELNERSRKILWAIIKSYIDFNGPVGSRMVTKRFPLGLSPATIRNTMADLNDLGYIVQPHTSAGRVPTDKAFRLYVDTLLQKSSLSPNNKFLQQLSKKLRIIEKDINRLVEDTAKTLSAFSHYLGVALPPQIEEITMKQIEFIKYRGNKVLCILVSEEGIVKNKIVAVDEIPSGHDIGRITEYLNSEMTGLTLREIKSKIISQMSKDKVICDKLIADALRMCKKAIAWETDYVVYSGGISGAYNLPDFATIAQIKKIFKAIEDKHLVATLLDKMTGSEGIQVFIGSENIISEMKDFSMVVATYNDGRSARGTIGIIGPTRMDYEQVIPMVNHTAKTLTQILSID